MFKLQIEMEFSRCHKHECIITTINSYPHVQTNELTVSYGTEKRLSASRCKLQKEFSSPMFPTFTLQSSLLAASSWEKKEPLLPFPAKSLWAG